MPHPDIPMDSQDLRHLVTAHRELFASGATRDPAFRLRQLRALRRAVLGRERELMAALAEDLGKPAFEAYGGEIAVVVNEIDQAICSLRSWMRPRRVRAPLALFPARAAIHREPYGVVLIIGPWNFPVQLLLTPLAGALAAGNCAVLKPGAAAPRTTRCLAALVAEHFDPAHVSFVEGGVETVQALLRERFDLVFFTGGTAAGRAVMTAAARHLTPVVLELGGKNPCIVDTDVDLAVAARRIAWGKFFNAGQSCVAVDYLLVHRTVKQELLERIVSCIRSFYGEDPSRSPDLARIVNEAHFDRLLELLGRGTIVTGGVSDQKARYLAPTVIDGITGDDPVMEEEIFGPILPVIAYDDLASALRFVQARPKPLALYVFSRDRRVQERVLAETASGGAGVNDVVLQEIITRLPFGGIGESGIGRYHGQASFDAFTYERSIVRNGMFPDILLRYPPYRGHLKLFRKFF